MIRNRYRILKNRDHCLVQVRVWFFWKYLSCFWQNEYHLSFFRSKAIKYNRYQYAEDAILELKRISSEIKKKKSKYQVIYPKVDSPLYRTLNDDENDY